jgi:hypothetical protein
MCSLRGPRFLHIEYRAWRNAFACRDLANRLASLARLGGTGSRRGLRFFPVFDPADRLLCHAFALRDLDLLLSCRAGGSDAGGARPVVLL